MISGSARVCSFTFSRTGLDSDQIFLSINGQLVSRAPECRSGWEYDPTTNHVTVFGPACDTLVNTMNAQLKVNYGCLGDLTAADGG